MKKLLLAFFLLPLAANAAEEKLDRSPEALKRGAHVVLEVCNACHGLKYVKFRDLKALGFTDAEVKTFAGENSPMTPIAPQMDADSAKSTFGVVPPDLSLMAKAREGGAHYIYEFVTGFYNTPKGETSNKVFPVAKMPDVFNIASASPQEKKDIEQKVQDAAVFLEWAADPQEIERKTMGRYVLGYLLVLSVLFYLLKKKVWGRLPPPEN